MRNTHNSLVIVTDHRFWCASDGTVWSSTFGDAAYWLSQAHPFRRVTVIARVGETAIIRPEWARADSPTVNIAALPSYLGPLAFVRVMPRIWKILYQYSGIEDGVVLTACPSILGTMMAVLLILRRRPCLVNVIGDPKTLFCKGAIRHPLRAVFGTLFLAIAHWQVRRAYIVRYVTAHYLQRQVEPRKDQLVYAFSDAMLEPSLYASTPRRHPGAGTPLLLISVGALDQIYKGYDDLLRAVALCACEGVRFKLEIFGEGKHHGELESLAAGLGLAGQVRFRGGLSRPQLLLELSKRGHLFVLPSKTEGLPRALLEAMAKGIPCLGTRVGGIPELLPEEALFNPGDPMSLKEKLLLSNSDSDWLNRLASNCLVTARLYSRDKLVIVQERMMGELLETRLAVRRVTHMSPFTDGNSKAALSLSSGAPDHPFGVQNEKRKNNF